MGWLKMKKKIEEGGGCGTERGKGGYKVFFKRGRISLIWENEKITRYEKMKKKDKY